jgi:hypothetical protein
VLEYDATLAVEILAFENGEIYSGVRMQRWYVGRSSGPGSYKELRPFVWHQV